jgi:hypothetical protein
MFKFLDILSKLFIPQVNHKRPVCRHCGGVRCIGACGLDHPAAWSQKTQAVENREHNQQGKPA